MGSTAVARQLLREIADRLDADHVPYVACLHFESCRTLWKKHLRGHVFNEQGGIRRERTINSREAGVDVLAW